MTALTNKKEEKIFTTTYYYWRYWVKNILQIQKVNCRFKRVEGYTGHILVDVKHKEKALRIFENYKINNPDIANMWW
jgi:hypothetical protein